ncbi:hypothetical protein [Gloeothece verrucosa]|uniref:Uncharacterized protein n=1 Tax=Gloeothece verrucosa (strain PCC 7822) TaxID=497965 RepID=E0UNS7_GLOV7|nr:hypothetical protein [Gloeothece verrucosa]ADN18607.1 conserved hypothetical protein [Gloeothece verrucosa PCC 7822]
MKSFVLSGLVVGLFALPVLSQTNIVRLLPFGNSDGQTRQREPETIYLSNGHGVTISFLSSSESIKQAWLDNPSFVVLFADGCLQGLQDNCQQQKGDIKVLHLKRINDLKIPGLPPSPRSLLTVITQSTEGKGSVYLFKIVKSTKPSYLVFEITAVENDESVTVNNHQILQIFRQGVLVAKQQKFLTEGSPLDKEVHNFLTYLSLGLSVEDAASKSGLSEKVVARLQELGQ